MYNYVLFGISDGYYRTIFNELEDEKNVKMLGDIVPVRAGKLLKQIWKFHLSPKINAFIRLPLKGIWYKQYFENSFDNTDPICFVFTGGQYLYYDYFRYLKRRYPDCKIVFSMRDTMKTYSSYPGFDIRKITESCDAIMSFNKYDCEKYGFQFFNGEQSYVPVQTAPDYPISDLFFAGLAKDRFHVLKEIYDQCVKQGIKCDFYVVRLPREEQVELPGITYSEKGMPYEEMLYRTVNSGCVLEISQKDAYGFTSRAFEAILYNKKLLTDSLVVRDQKFMDSGYIQFFEDPAEIDYDFIKKDLGKIDYQYNGEYSPKMTLKAIEDAINSQNEKRSRADHD